MRFSLGQNAYVYTVQAGVLPWVFTSELQRRDFVSILDRILLFLLSIASLCLGVALALVGANVLGADVQAYVETSPVNVVAIVAGIIIIVLALRFLFYRTGRPQTTDAITLTGDHGQIRISYETIRQLANRRGSQVRGAQEFDTRIRTGQEGVVILVRMQVLPDIDIAATSREVQTVVKEYVEQHTSVNVEHVLVHVTELSPAQKQGKAWSGA
ncbi:alkaline shock response membrane anchor protein AmaP [Alicyclobacillus fastidiosus]|uniref:Alkaline shock response membrane anchor protein AmaP n=1 Tax=Alicyclobacillus fastidiosus TaxID=392011 RepID=A0ABY6ZN81_9BACL|nr:alkaline shock response membrane anchor protein AmaP [Alicyclobacillus fastidiosus]WAH44297.1 alkaline shock response membrane anchor protein AmaP [Alicyclobacillus fastidiosus]